MKTLLRSSKLRMAIWTGLCFSLPLTTWAAATDCTATTVTGIGQAQCDALLSIYNDMGGTSWTNKTDWNETDMPCSWPGITCTDNNVTGIALPNNGLTGTLPGLSAFNELQQLQLSGNVLTAFPNLTGLTKLTLLDLSNTQLTGTIPDLNSLTELQTLRLNDNQLTGPVPALDALTKLETLDISGNPQVYLNAAVAYGDNQAKLTDATNNLIYYRCSKVTGISPPQCETLFSLYKETGGANWTIKTGWNDTDTPCTTPWEGIKCDSDGNVTEIDLTSHNLKGTLPNLSGLTSLQKLQLGSNQLTGIADLTGPTSLTVLDLSNNQLTGTIPNLNSLVELQTLRLNGNQFTGAIPDLTLLVKLETLQLNGNQLSGPVPALEVLDKLLNLDVSDNPVNAASQLCLDTTTKYGVNQDKLTSTPNSLSNCSTETECTKVSEIPQTQCEALVSLYKGTDGANWTAKDGWNQTNNAPCSWKGITCADGNVTKNVTKIELSANKLAGTLPDLSAFTELQELKLDGNKLTGSLPDLASLTKLTWLDLSDNQFEGVIPALNLLPDLSTLDVSNNLVVDNTPQLCLGAKVDYGTNREKLTGVPNQLPYCGGLCAAVTETSETQCQTLLSLYNKTDGSKWSVNTGWNVTNTPCSWEGIICSEDKLTVTEINLANHNLTGTLPDLSDLTGLQKLQLGGNQLTGIANLTGPTSLTVLDLSKNKLADTIPDLHLLVNLDTLLLNGNQLSGPVPALDALTKLSNLDVSDNLMDGDKPQLCLDTTTEYVPNKDKLTTNGLSDCKTECTKVTDIPQTQCEALLALYNGTDGLNWTARKGWDSTNTPCNWYGIICTDGNVTKIDLSANNLTADTLTLPDLSAFTELQELKLGSNQLTGSFPDLASLIKLTLLDLSNNQLTGSIPDLINLLVELQTLRLKGNQLNGPLPALHALTQLQTLDVSENLVAVDVTPPLCLDPTLDYGPSQEKLTTTPNDLVYCKCLDVTEIPQAQCRVLLAIYNKTGGSDKWTAKDGWNNTNTPCSWKGVTCAGRNVTKIDLSINGLTGTLPDFSALTDLRELKVGNNQLSGPVPELSTLTQLKTLEINDNSALCVDTSLVYNNEETFWKDTLTGTPNNLPNCVTNCAKVTDIPKNQCETLVALFKGTDGDNWQPTKEGWNNNNTPCSWEGITCADGQVTGIDLTNHSLKGTLPNLSALTGLQALQLDDNQLTGTLPSLSPLTSLQKLILGHNQLTGTFPDLSKLTALQVLDVSYNALSGTLPGLSTLKELQTLLLGNNQFTGEIPDWSHLVKLQELHLAGSQLTGTLSDLVSLLTNLVELTLLDLSNNQLEGPLPAVLDTFTKLQTLRLASNKLTGEIPDLTKLTEEELATNKLLDLTKLTKLAVLDLSNNAFTGTLPSILTKLVKLQQLLLAGNQLTGSLLDLSPLKELQVLDVSNNQLSGTLPSSLSGLVTLQTLSLNGNQFTGLIPELNGLTNLVFLSLKDNKLEGPIPALDKLKPALLTLELSNNVSDKPELVLCKDPTRKDSYGEWARWNADLIRQNWAVVGNDLDKFSTCMGEISGVKFNDIMDNGRQDVWEPVLAGHTITVNNSATGRAFSIQTNPDGTYTIKVPYGTNSITSNNLEPYTQQTTPVPNPPVTTAPFTVETSWTLLKKDKVNFGVHALNALIVKSTRSLTASDGSKITVAFTGPDGNSIEMSCSTTCIFYFPSTDTITLTAVDSAGSSFTGWLGNCATSARNNTHIMTMDGNKSCTAHFDSFSCNSVVSSGFSLDDCNALVSIYESTRGETWTDNTGWLNFPPSPCEWKGVTCTSDGTRVLKIELPNNNLNGTLPSLNVNAFTELEMFDVSGNSSLCQKVSGNYGSLESQLVSIEKCPQLPPVAAFDILPPPGSMTVKLDASPLKLDASPLKRGAAATYKWTTLCGDPPPPQPDPDTTTNIDTTADPDTTTVPKIPVSTADGVSSSITFPITFPQEWVCEIILTVTEGGQTESFDARQVKVPVKSPIVAKTNDGSEAFRIEPDGLTVYLDATPSSGEISSYEWETTAGPETFKGKQTSINFPRNPIKNSQSTYGITLKVTDGETPSFVTQTVTVPAISITVDRKSRNLANPGSGQIIFMTSNGSDGDFSSVSPVPLNCFPDVCVKQRSNFNPGTSVLLKAKPYTGYIFTGWEGDCSNDGWTVDLDASALKLPEGSKYEWTTSCPTDTGTSPIIKNGVNTFITFPATAATCDVTLKVTSSEKQEQFTTSVSLPLTEGIIVVKTNGTATKETYASLDDLGDDAFYILPYSNFSEVVAGSKECTAYFEVDPNRPANVYKLEVELRNAKTKEPDPGAGRVVDNRLTINLGDEYNQWWTYYSADKKIKLRSLPSHPEKINSGSKTYWEFTQWNCYKKDDPSQKILPYLNDGLASLPDDSPQKKSAMETLTKKPQFRFTMPAYDTFCQVYFNSELDIAGKELRDDFNTAGKGALDTGEPTFVWYPKGDSKNNEEREREGLYWAQPAILMVESFIGISALNTPEELENVLEKAWSQMEANGLTDRELFPKPLPEGTVEEGKRWTQSVRIRPTNAKVDGLASTSVTVSGYYIEVRVKLLNADNVEEEVPILVYWGDPPFTLEETPAAEVGGDSPINLAFLGEELSVVLSGGIGGETLRWKPSCSGSNCLQNGGGYGDKPRFTSVPAKLQAFGPGFSTTKTFPTKP